MDLLINSTRSVRIYTLSLLVLSGIFTGCGDGDDDSAMLDASMGDSGGNEDAGGGTDAGPEDAGGNDAGGEDSGTGCSVTPAEWSAADFETNAATALALRAAIGALQNDLMNNAEQVTWGDSPTAAPVLMDLTDAYEAGTPSVSDVTPAALDALMQQTFTDWVSAMAGDPATYMFIDVDGTEWIASGDGGVHERPPAEDTTRRFRAYSSSGIELRQLVDKGLFVGALYNYALSLTEETITPATIHAIAAAWGSNANLDPNPAEDEEANDDSAAYSQDMGLYDETAQALIAAQAYAGDDSCTVERDAALVEVFRFWEEAMFARGTYYGGAPQRSTLDPSDAETVLGPLHAMSEGYGLILGLRGMPEPASGPLAGNARVSTDDDIDQALEALGVDVSDISASTTGEWLVEEPMTYEDGFEGDFKDVVQTLFGWDDALFTEYATSPVPTE